MTEVNTEPVALLADALESGEFPKGTRALHVLPDGNTPEGFCCLGVACVVAMRNGLELETSERSVLMRKLEFFAGEHSYLPQQVREWYGFSSNNPSLAFSGNDRYPAGMMLPAAFWNDEIADSTLADIGAGFRRTFLQEGTADGE